MNLRYPVPLVPATPAVAGVFHLFTSESPLRRSRAAERRGALVALGLAQCELSAYQRRHPAPRTHFERGRCAELAFEVARCETRLRLAKRYKPF